MNLRLLYGLIYGFFGFIIASLISAFFYSISTVLLWTFIIEDGAWPHWLLLLLVILFVLILVSLNIKFILTGFKKGELLDEEDEEYKEENLKKAKLLLKLSILSLLIFISFLSFKIGNINIKRKHNSLSKMQNIGGAEKSLSSIEFRQKEKILEIVVGIDGKSSDTHKISVEVIAVGDKSQRLLEFKQEVPLTYSHQQFVFPVPFDTLAKKFNKYFSQYVEDLDKKIGVDALIKVVVHLKNQEASSIKKKKSGAFEEKKEAFVRFFFSCKNDLCIVSQFDKYSDIPTEKIKNKLKK